MAIVGYMFICEQDNQVDMGKVVDRTLNMASHFKGREGKSPSSSKSIARRCIKGMAREKQARSHVMASHLFTRVISR